ncbi:MAG: polysaccharide biosynthesis tyrosine autokinase [Bacteroidota bacterium]
MISKTNSILDTKDVKRAWFFFLNNWYIIFIVLILSAASAFFYSYKLPKIFAAKTQFLLKNTETYSYQQDIYQSLGLYGSQYLGYEKMANEKMVITSVNTIAQTIAKLKLEVSYFIIGRLQTLEMYSGTPFFVEAKIYSAQYYEYPFTFKIINTEKFEITFERDEQQIIEVHRFGEPIINKDFYFNILKSNAINNSTIFSLKEIAYQFVVHDQNNLLYKYKSILDVKNLDWTAIMEVTVEDESPERAVEFLDTLAKVYMDNSQKTKIKINENTIGYINRQIEEVTDSLNFIENLLENFKEQKAILNLTKEEEIYFSNLTTYEISKRNLELQLKSITYLKNYITSNLNKDLLPPALYIEENDAYLQKSIQELYNLQVEINSTLFTTTEKSMVVKEKEYKIEFLRNDILKYLVNSDNAIQEKIRSLDGEITYYEKLLKGVPRNQRQILNINRKLAVNEKLYMYLLEKKAETVIARAGIVSDVSVIETAHSIGIIKPDKNQIFYSFLSGGFIIAIFIMFIRAFFFSEINKMEELREETNFPVLGEVFHAKEAKNSYMIVDVNPRSFITESFRLLRTNLDYMAPDIKCKIVLITSNRPSVGKTFCSINLGVILAKGGKKVLIVEMDLHKPKIHKALNITSEVGMSSYLVGKSAYEEIITNTSVENLDVILSGPTPPNASELIMSDNLRKLFELARKKYDYIVVDTPPLGIISDALLLMKYSDVNLFILNTKISAKEGVEFAHNMILDNKINGFAFVLNNVKPKYSRYYYKKYKYDYGYGYVQS